MAGARRVWRKASRCCPTARHLPARGRWELDHGDLQPAAVDISTAAAKAPQYADPLKAWGDLLAR
jgi:hypothetical protein